MENLPNFDQLVKEDYLCNMYLSKLRESITIHILTQNLKNKFYNMSDFFLQQKINNENIKKLLFQKIINELKQRNFIVATAFNKTSIILAKNEDDMNENIWKTSLDFERI